MGYTYDINLSKQDKRSSICLFSCHMIYNIIVLFLSTFLVSHIYSLSDNVFDYIKNVATFETVQYACMLVCIPIFSWIVEKTNRTWVYRFSMLVSTSLVIFSIFYGAEISKYIVLAGAIYGSANGIYYAAYNTIKQEMVSRKSMRTFSVVSQIFTNVVKIVVPILMGALIDVSSYSQVAIYVLVICAIQIGFSFGVRSKRPENSHFNLKTYFKKLKENTETLKKMKIIYWCSFIYGFTTIVSTMLQICIMIQFGSSFSLGALTSVFSAVSVCTILIFNKFTKAGKRTGLYIFSALIPVVFSWIFCFFPAVWSLIIFELAITISKIIFSTVFDIYRNGILKEAGLYSEITEHQAIIEILLEISRIISFAFLIVITLFNSLTIFYVLLAISVLAYSVTTLILLYYENKFIAQPKDTEPPSPNVTSTSN